MQGPPPSAAGGSQPNPSVAWNGQHPHQHAAPGAAPSPQGQPAYYTGYPTPWQYGGWPYPYNPNMPPGAYPNPYMNNPAQPQPQVPAVTQPPPPKRKTPSPPPAPPPSLPRDWDHVLRAFLKNAGLSQALRGLELDMLVLNEEREKVIVPPALEALQLGLKVSRGQSQTFRQLIKIL